VRDQQRAPGEYWVVETLTPPGYDTAADQHASVTPDRITLTFVDPPAGAIWSQGAQARCLGTGDHHHEGVTSR
jgi:hypothetical protein